MSSSPRSLVDELFGICLLVLAGAVALNWAWHLLRPLLPVIVFGVVVALFLRWQRR